MSSRLRWMPVALLALAGSSERPAQAQARPAPGPGKKAPFRHQSHVPGAWTEWDAATGMFRYGELNADCLGCHDTSNPTPIAADLCERCHYAGFQTDGARARAPNDLFLHSDHARYLVCRNCHSTRDVTGAIDRDRRNVPDDIHVLTGTGSCLACHGPQSAGLYDKVIAREKNDAVLSAADGKLAGVIARLNVASSMGPSDFGGQRGFFHRQHLVGWPAAFATPNADAAGSCGACHAGVASSVSSCEALARRIEPTAAALGDAIFSADGCAECHTSPSPAGAGGVARTAVLERRPWQSLTSGTFSHRDHLANPSTGKDATLAGPRSEIAASGCLGCHPLDDPRNPLTFGLKPSFASSASVSSYDECVRCHVAPGQRVQDSMPGDDLDRLTHAQLIKDTSVCQKCHQLGHVADMKTLPARVSVKRPRGLEFSIATHAHEFITLKSDGKEKDKAVAASCVKCHVSDPAEQASRIQKARFSHSTHLPRMATARDCAACHGKIDASKEPADIGTGAVPLYDESACKRCHKATPVPADPAAGVEERPVPLFAHADHVGKPLANGKKLECDACHESQVPDGQPAVGVREEARTCKPCHSHRDSPQYTGDASGEFVESCVYCHKTGVPAAGQKLPPQERIHVAGFSGRQLHPPPSERACDVCHAALITELSRGATIVTTDSRDAVAATGYWRGAGRSEFHKTYAAQERSLSRNGREFGDNECACCHWAQQGQAEAVQGGKAPFRWPDRARAPQLSFADRRALTDEGLARPKYPGASCCK